MEKLFFKQTNVSIDYIFDRFEEKETKKERPIKNSQSEWLINYIPNPTKETVGSFEDKAVNLFKTNTPEEYDKQTMYGSLNRPNKLKIEKQSEDNIIKCIRNLSKLKKRE